MGDYKIVIHAAGGHGCERKAVAGEVFYGCGSQTCPDCFWAKAIWEWKRLSGDSAVHDATFTHWPASMNQTHGRSYREAEEVVDDINYFTQEGYYSTRMRKRIKGKFGG